VTPAERARRESLFRDPPAAFRSLPFWAWNARLENAEIADQIRSMKERGMGGFFMHSRDGLETPYMGSEWIDAVKTAVRVAEEEGLAAWLYDEDRWPSGASGGKVPARGDAYRAKGLTLELREGGYDPDSAGGPAPVALFRARLDGLRWLGGERLDPALPHPGGPESSFLVFRIEAAAGDEWFNGEAPPDNLNPDAVDAFIDLNYKPYRDAVGERFGKSVPGIFTDEPSVHDRHSRYSAGRGWVPWTYRFAAFFAERRGYDPLDAMPQVFFDGPLQARIRHDYWRTVTELFSESYTKRIGAWCAESGLKFTGHFLWENQLGTATRTGGAIMPHYRFQDVPGIDLLCEQIEETITVKQCTSVANQYGKERVLTETYGCVGWEFTFEGQKWLGDWQFVMGVNVRCQHLALYSLKGCRKRDYPPVFNYNTTWWSRAKIVEDYFARLSAILTEGTPVRDLLILHPASTAWSRLGSNPRGFADRGADRNLPELNVYGDGFNRLLRAVLGAHHDFDLGDETIMAEAGRTEGATLFVARASYKLVLLPPVDTLLRSTVALLRAFLDGGGRAVAIEPGAAMAEGVPSAEAESLYRHPNLVRAAGPAEALKAVENLLPRAVSLRNRYLAEDPELLCMLRRNGDEAVLFAVNTDRTEGREILIEVDGEGAVEELDPLTGNIGPRAAEASGGKTRFRADFGPAGSRLYRLDFAARPAVRPAGAPSAAPDAHGASPDAHSASLDAHSASLDAHSASTFSPTPNFLSNPPILGALGPTARFSRTEPNALVLDRCSYELAGGPRSAEMEVWRAQKEIRAELGMRQVYYNGLAQRYAWIGEPHEKDGAEARFFFSFEVAAVPAGEVFLVLEESAEYRILLNGAEVPSRPTGWFLDKSFQKIPLPRLAPGKNELVLSCAYKNRMEAEDCFILGDFAVDGARRIAAEPAELRFGDWCLQGYPHYCGSMVYRFELERPAGERKRAVLHPGDFSATTLEVRANGAVAGQVPWRSAGGIDLTAFLREGTNSIEIEAVGSPRNLLGPFHLARGKVSFNEWSAFRPEGADYTPGYVLEPYGLFGQVVLSRE
jgi:hypothetical protein